MKLIFSILVFITLNSCSNFNKFASDNSISQVGGYVCFSNQKINVSTLTFGDIKFASKRSEFKKLNSEKPKFNDILFYASTTDPAYDYYVLVNPKEIDFLENNYFKKDTIINNFRIVLLISKSVPISDKLFLEKNISTTNQP